MVAELQLEAALAQLGESGEVGGVCEAGGTDETGVAKIGENGEIPLYCSRPGVRLIISLLDGDEHTRYWKLPDAVVDVHQNLGNSPKTMATMSARNVSCAPASNLPQPAYVSTRNYRRYTQEPTNTAKRPTCSSAR